MVNNAQVDFRGYYVFRQLTFQISNAGTKLIISNNRAQQTINRGERFSDSEWDILQNVRTGRG